MRDLLTEPSWQSHELGLPLPVSPHAVSVSLPLWEHVIGYEEGDAAVTDQFQSGYPRFFLPPLLRQLFAQATELFASPGESAMVFPSHAAAERCVRYAGGGRIHQWQRGVAVVCVPESLLKRAKLYWRFSGEIVSTRVAEAISQEQPAADGSQAASEIRRRLATLHGVGEQDVFLFASGMAAVFSLHTALLKFRAGLPTVQLDFPYVDVLKVQEEFGASPPFFFPVGNEAAVEQVRALAANGSVGAIFCEMPSNPLLRSVRLSQLKGGVPLIVDDTVATCANVSAINYADAVTTSLTKTFSGVGDVIAGAVILNPASPHYKAFKTHLSVDAPLAAEDAIVLERNSRDFAARVARMNQNAAALAEMLEAHPAVEEVFYPGKLSTDGIYEILQPGGGLGPLLSFNLKNPAKAPAVYDALRVCKGPSLGSNFTLVCPYTLLAHYQELAWAANCGVAAHLLRVSAGLEEMDDLLARFREALAAA
jgi:cystathionine gamma-synthase